MRAGQNKKKADGRHKDQGLRYPGKPRVYEVFQVRSGIWNRQTGGKAHIYIKSFRDFLPGGFARIFYQRSLTSIIILPNKATATMRISKVSIGTAIHSATLKTNRITGATIKAKTQINISAPQPVEKFLKKSANDEFPGT
ncbi:MAG: hypothetical protein ACLFUY_09195 [Desulfobacterales bacterium]